MSYLVIVHYPVNTVCSLDLWSVFGTAVILLLDAKRKLTTRALEYVALVYERVLSAVAAQSAGRGPCLTSEATLNQ